MRISILISILTCLTTLSLSAQKMSWVASKYTDNKACEDLTNCADNMVCYNLKYEPAHSGILTSYTTGFIIDCTDNVSSVKTNSTCLMDDHSEQFEACETESKILLHCSGNTGQVPVVKGEAIYVHQICIQMTNSSEEVNFDESDIVQLTASIDTEQEGAVTEYIDYEQFRVMNSHVFCEQTADYLSLSVKLSDNVATLEWEPTREVVDGYYTVHHSVDGVTYDRIGTFDSEMLTQGASYKYAQDVTLEKYGEHLFYVSYESRDTDLKRSNVVQVYYKDVRFAMNLAPNPTVDRVKIVVTSNDSEVQLRVSNQDGKIVLQQIIATDDESWIDLSNLIPGLYNISVFSNDDQLTEKVILLN